MKSLIHLGVVPSGDEVKLELEEESALGAACAAVSRDKNPAYVKDSELCYIAVNEAYAELWDAGQSGLIGQQSHQHFDAAEQNDRDEKERRTLVFGQDQIAEFNHPLKNKRFRIRIVRNRCADGKPFICGHFEPINGVRYETETPAGSDEVSVANETGTESGVSSLSPEPQSETAIRGDCAHLKAAIELASIPIAVEDASGRIIAASAAYLESEDQLVVTTLPNGGKLRMTDTAQTTRDKPSLASVARIVDGTKNRIHNIFDMIDIGIVIYDPTECISYVNPALKELLGKTFEPVVGMHMREVVAASWNPDRTGMDLDAWIEKGMSELYLLGEPRIVEIGGGRWIRVVNQQLEDGSVLGIRLDVTEMVKREKALETMDAKNELFRAVLDALPIPTFIKDKDFKYVFANQALAAVAKYPVQEMIGKTDFKLFGKQSTTIRDSDIEVMKTGSPLEVELPMVRPNGRDLFLISRKTRFDTPEGQSYLLGSTLNITALKKREAELVSARQAIESAANLLETAAGAMVQGLCIVQNKVIQFSNSQLQQQLDVPAELLEPGRDWRDVFNFCFDRGDFGWTDRKAVIQEIADCAALGTNYSVEHKKPDGQWVRVDTQSGADGKLVMTTTDVTDARNRESDLGDLLEKAEDADRAKSEFLANMSHEIRTPMNGVLGMAELLSRTSLDNRQKTFTDIIIKSGSALLTIINDILDFSKIDAGQMVLETNPIDLREIIEDVATLVSARAVEKNVELIVRIDPSLNARVIGDSGRMRQILTNLVGNAVKFTEVGYVLISLEGTAANNKLKFRISVEDTGVGIPPGKLDEVFDKFSQVDGSSTRSHEGTGLGLAITARLVELMGGQVRADSEVGKGSVFTVSLELPADLNVPKPAPVPVDVTGARILVVDDNPVNRQILTEQLDFWGFDGCAAQSGDEAREVIKAVEARDMTIDAVILDYHMPRENGADLARFIRANHSTSELPVIMLTSMDIRNADAEFSALDVQATLMKPARASVLYDTLIQTLNSSFQHRMPLDVSGNGARRNATALPQEACTKAPETLGNQGESADAGPGAWIDEMHERHDFKIGPNSQNSANSELEILVAEDNDVNQIVFSQILDQMGVRYQLVTDGGAVVKAWQKHSPAMVLMDVSMPVQNGYQATGEIRKIEAETPDRPRTPIIGVTAHALTGDRENCIEAGMDDYLPKPISPDKLEAKIREWISLDKVKTADKSG